VAARDEEMGRRRIFFGRRIKGISRKKKIRKIGYSWRLKGSLKIEMEKVAGNGTLGAGCNSLVIFLK